MRRIKKQIKATFAATFSPPKHLIVLLLSLFIQQTGFSSSPIKAAPLDDRGCHDLQKISLLIGRIDRSGAFKNTANFKLNKIALCLAQNYKRSGAEKYAYLTAQILLRYADVVQHWPYIGMTGKIIEKPNFLAWDLGGFWQTKHNWIFNDLGHSANLAKAYLLIKNSDALKKIAQNSLSRDIHHDIREKLLRFLVDSNLRFGRGGKLASLKEEAVFPFSNMDPYRLKALIAFGKAVDPAYIHIAVYFLRKFPTTVFFRDGFWHEGSVSYHRQVIDKLAATDLALFGYSDPAGYHFKSYKTIFGDVYPGVTGQFIYLDPLGKARAIFQKAKQADHALTYPDGSMVTKNDTHAAARGSPEDAPTQSACLFALRHCTLVMGKGAKRSIVHLGYGGTEGHEHFDALHLDFWAQNMLMSSDGDYGSGTLRPWAQSVRAHNTVVIDGKEQDNRFSDQEELTLDDRVDGLGFHLWQGQGHGNTNNQGDLLAADLLGNTVQYIMADAKRAYDSQIALKDYKRIVMLINGSTLKKGGHSYLVDIFYIRGGNHHDWMMHGNLGLPYRLQTNPALPKAKGRIGKYLKIGKQKNSPMRWTSQFIYRNGKSLKTFHLQTRPAQITRSTAPALKTKATAPFLAVAQTGTQSLFIKLHSPQSGKQNSIRSVNLLKPVKNINDPVFLKVQFVSGRLDIITIQPAIYSSTASQDSAKPLIDYQAKSRTGKCLLRYKGDLSGQGRVWQKGLVAIKRDLDSRNHYGNGFILDHWPHAPKQTPALLHIQLPNKVVESYKIKKVIQFSNNRVFVKIEGDPGFRMRPATAFQKRGEKYNLKVEKNTQIAKKQKTGLLAGKNIWFVKNLYYPARAYVGTLSYRTTLNQQTACAK